MASNLKRIPVGAQVTGWPSESWDTICTAVETLPQFRQQAAAPTGMDKRRSPALLGWIKNESGSDLLKGNVLGVDDILMDFSVTANRGYIFDEVPRFTGIAPTVADHKLSLAVLLQDLDDNGEGWAAVAGWAWALVDVTNSAHTHAKIDDGETLLISGTSGAKILVKESGTGTKKALLNLATYVDSQTKQWFGKTTSTVTAASGDPTRTLGSGSVEIYTNSGTSGTTTSEVVTAYNTMESAIATDTYVHIAEFASGDKFITAVDCV